MSATDSKVERHFFPAVLLALAAVVTAFPAIAADGQNVQNGTTAGQVPESQRVRDFSDATLAKIVPGHTAQSDVESLLGTPWRESEIDEESIPYPGDPSVKVWEYRGKDSQGTYRVHIEFDKNDVTTLIAKIPDKAARAVARVASPVPDSAKQ